MAHFTYFEDVTRRDNKTVITVARESHYVVSQDTKAENIYVYPGAENSLRITRVYSTKWLCSYNMLYYPFDTQTCPLIMEPSGNSKTFLLLTEGTHEYLGPTELTQYFVR